MAEPTTFVVLGIRRTRGLATRRLAQVYLDQIGGEPHAGRMEITLRSSPETIAANASLSDGIADFNNSRCTPARPISLRRKYAPKLNPARRGWRWRLEADR